MNREDKRTTAWIANALLSSLLVGNQCPDVKARYERMKDPQPGDLIFEASTLPRLLNEEGTDSDLWDGQFVRLIRSGMEHWYTDEEGVDHDEMVYVCANPDGTEFRWTNASVWALPDRPRWSSP